MLKIATGRVAYLGTSPALADVHLPRIAGTPAWILPSRTTSEVLWRHLLARSSFPFPSPSATDLEAGAKFLLQIPEPCSVLCLGTPTMQSSPLPTCPLPSPAGVSHVSLAVL